MLLFRCDEPGIPSFSLLFKRSCTSWVESEVIIWRISIVIIGIFSLNNRFWQQTFLGVVADRPCADACQVGDLMDEVFILIHVLNWSFLLPWFTLLSIMINIIPLLRNSVKYSAFAYERTHQL
jgi:hypothetical protein